MDLFLWIAGFALFAFGAAWTLLNRENAEKLAAERQNIRGAIRSVWEKTGEIGGPDEVPLAIRDADCFMALRKNKRNAPIARCFFWGGGAVIGVQCLRLLWW